MGAQSPDAHFQNAAILAVPLARSVVAVSTADVMLLSLTALSRSSLTM